MSLRQLSSWANCPSPQIPTPSIKEPQLTTGSSWHHKKDMIPHWLPTHGNCDLTQLQALQPQIGPTFEWVLVTVLIDFQKMPMGTKFNFRWRICDFKKKRTAHLFSILHTGAMWIQHVPLINPFQHNGYADKDSSACPLIRRALITPHTSPCFFLPSLSLLTPPSHKAQCSGH